MVNSSKILEKLNFNRTDSTSGKYNIWTSSRDPELWVAIPKNIKESQRSYFENIITDTILTDLDIDITQENRNEILSQLTGFNYKIYNKISLKEQMYTQSIPYELAQITTLRSITSLRTYSHQFSTKLKDIPIDRFQLSHTKKGSFVIPISILYEEKEIVLPTFPTELSKVIKGYLNKISMLDELNTSDIKKFTEEAFERELPSSLLRDIIGPTDSIATIIEKYGKQLSHLQISSKGNPILDRDLTDEDREYKVVDLLSIKPLNLEYIEALSELETKQNEMILEEHSVYMYVEVNAININGTAMFNVYQIEDQTLEKPFKAQTVKLSDARIYLCADALKSRAKIKIKGDITKKRRKIGEVVVDNIENEDDSNILSLFGDTSIFA